jgi:tetratricopeptide (TPR) repeat protein/nucleoside phosphorylase
MDESKYVTHIHAPVQGLVIGEHNRVQSTYQDMAEESEKENSLVFDVCIVCALAEEAQAFLHVVEEYCHLSWTNEFNLRYKYDYRFAKIPNVDGESLNIHVSWLPRYGPQEMALHLGHVVEEYQPRFVAMTGICAGDKRHVRLGDLVVAERAFTYDSGKVVKDEQGQAVHQHDTITYQAHESTLQFLRLFGDWRPRVAALPRPFSKQQQRDWLLEGLFAEPTGSVKAIPLAELEWHAPAWRQLVHELQQGAEPFLSPSRVLRDKAMIEHLHYGLVPFPFQDPPEALCHIRALASGSAVRSDNPFKEVQIPVRGAVAIDMEGAAFGRVMEGAPSVEWLIVKGVSDYADSDKDDSYHTYAATASAMYILCFLENYVTRKRLPLSRGKHNASRDGPQPLWNIPYPRNPCFTGHEELLTQLAGALTEGQATALSQPQAISGLGGIGKTQIAVEFAYRHQQNYQTVLWALADTRESLVSGYLAIAELLDLPQKNEQDQMVIIKAVIYWLQTHGSWLLILDNADDLALVQEFLPPSSSGHILLTTRAQAMGRLASCIEVEVMSQDVGALFLLRRATLLAPDASSFDQASRENRVAALQITEELGGLPLALDQAGAYLEETQCTPAEYLGLYRAQRSALLEMRGGLVNDHPDPVATTWSLSFKQVEQKNPAAADLLRISAFLAPDAIPEEVIREGARHLDERLQTGVTNPLLFNEMIKDLRAYSLIDRNAQEKTLSVHRLVQAVLKDTMDEPTQRQWAEWVVGVVNVTFPLIGYQTWSQCERCLPHALVCIELIEEYQLIFSEVAHFLNQIGYYLKQRGRYQEAEPLYRRALSLRVQKLGEDHPDTAQSLNNLAVLYDTQGKYAEAEPVYRRALEVRERQLGMDHPDTANTLNNLAVCYQNQGKYREAEPLYGRALSIYEQQSGAGHSDMANILNNLATLYQSQGRYAEAEPVYRRVLTIQEQQLGEDHPQMATSLGNLAELCRLQGKYTEAEPLYMRALAIKEHLLGEDHPLTASSLNNLALLYEDQGRYEQAEPLTARSLAIYEQRFGTQHSNTAIGLTHLGYLYRVQGKYAEAEPLLKRALSIREERLGSDHPDTANSLSNLALLYQNQGKYAEAEPLFVRALAISKQQLGDNHPSTAQSLNNLAGLYDGQGKYSEAEPLFRQALFIREEQLGGDHPDTAQSLNNLAALYYAQGKYSEAEPLYRQALIVNEQHLGEDHPNMAGSLNNLARLYQTLEKCSESVPLYRRALTIYIQRLGGEHPITQRVRSNYISLLRKMGRDEEADLLEESGDNEATE